MHLGQQQRVPAPQTYTRGTAGATDGGLSRPKMSLLGQYTKERNKAETDWDDAQRRIGNLPELEKPESSGTPFPELEPAASDLVPDDPEAGDEGGKVA